MKQITLKNLESCTWCNVELMGVSEWDMSVEEFEKLIEEHKTNPNDVNLISYIAFVWYLNISSCEDSMSLDVENIQGLEEDISYLNFFELAYKTNPTIETIHNYANVLFIWEEKLYADIINIQLQCIALKPKSSIPYTSLAYMYLDSKDYENALEYYEIALEKALKNNEKTNEIYPNLGACYCETGQYDKAIAIFKQENEDYHHTCYLYNIALCYTHLKDRAKFLATMEEFKNHAYFESSVTDFVDLYTVWQDYEIVDYYVKDNFYLIYYLNSYSRILHAMYKVNKPKFDKLIEKEIQKCLDSIEGAKQIKENTHVYDFKTFNIESLQKEIKFYKEIENKFKNNNCDLGKPQVEIWHYETSWFFPKFDD